MGRTWRKLVKKLQRKKKRQLVARERDKELEEDELDKLKDPSYKLWLERQKHLEQLERLAAEKEQQENEEIWLRRELLSQKQFQWDEQIRKDAERVQEELRMQQENELKEREEALERRRDAIRQRTEQAAKKFEDTMQLMQNYLEDCNMRTPKELQGCNETRPGEKQCEFFEKTHCCRFGFRCSHNHSRPLLSRVIVIRNFFQHRYLDQQFHGEYTSAEERIEVSECDLKSDYKEFCADVWPELEQFGVIVNFRTVRNRMPHARGHVFVEFVDKRSALKAFINLQNRYYASKRLNVEFSHVTHWRTAVCGFSLARKCPKGAFCNYLHLIPNPHNKYNAPLEPLERSQRSKTKSGTLQETPLLSWNNVTAEDDTPSQRRSWRWSESPEIEIMSNETDTQLPLDHSEGERVKKISANEYAESIVLSSSSSEDEDAKERLKRKSTTESHSRRAPEYLKRKQKSNWSHRPKERTIEVQNKIPRNCRWSEDTESIILSSSSSDYEADGEVRRKLNSGDNRSSACSNRKDISTGNRKQYSKSRHKHDKQRTSRMSPRKMSSHHRRQNHKYSDKSR